MKTTQQTTAIDESPVASAEQARSDIRRYTTDDRDLPEDEQMDLVLLDARSANGDWYLGVWPKGARSSRHTVRLCNSGGAASARPGMPVALARLWDALSLVPAKVQTSPWREPMYLDTDSGLEPLGVLPCTHEGAMKLDAAGNGTCEACGANGFPVTPEAAGASACCGGFGECFQSCDGQVRQPWALAKRVQDALEIFVADVSPIRPEDDVRVQAMLKDLRLIRHGGHELPEQNQVLDAARYPTLAFHTARCPRTSNPEATCVCGVKSRE